MSSKPNGSDRCREPRERAIPRLVAEHGGTLYALGKRLCGNADQAEDLVQETFLQAYRKWDQFEGRSQVTTWLYAIAARICQRMHRKRSGEPEHIESLEELLPFAEPEMAVVPNRDDSVVDVRIREEGRAEVERAIAELPEAFRMPLVLKEIAGLSIAEIAEVLGINEVTARTRLHRARLRVRKAVENVLPRRVVPPVRFSRQVCLDLLRAKQETLDRGVGFEFPDQVVCERCSELFSTMDLARDLCQEIRSGSLPEEVRGRVLERMAAEK